MFGATELPYMAVLWTQILRPTKLPYMAVLWTLFGCLSQNPYKTADLSSSMDTFRLQTKVSVELPYMAVLWDGNRNADLGSSMNTFNLDKFQVTKTATY